MQDRRTSPRGRGQPDSNQHVPDLRDARIGEHALDVILEYRDKRRGKNADQSQPHEDRIKRHVAEREIGTEDIEDETQQDVDRDLGCRCGKEGCDH